MKHSKQELDFKCITSLRKETGGPGDASLGINAGYTLDRVPTHHRAHTHSHSLTQYRQFRDANQPTMHVFGLGEETGVPRGNPRGTVRTCKLRTHMAEA
ncbi:hypothetical protein QTP70_015025 [Hemibagrus guttatus]|uniref:Uncharacterized protein n=1 Tax=Hemibagrus guttatus TaxID=175788 RepID=A0AAE0RCK7_9TELE|nr:hypothetical protein QTP70_015025 [Hemibagrus guttatus]